MRWKGGNNLEREEGGRMVVVLAVVVVVVVVVVVGCSIHSVSLAEAGRYRYSLQGDSWPKRVRVASSGVQYKEES